VGGVTRQTGAVVMASWVYTLDQPRGWSAATTQQQL
jgi:hypothetical protein